MCIRDRVEGGDSEWFEYPSKVVVAEEDSVYIYVTPTETGKHDITVSVVADTEDIHFSDVVSLYVSPAAYEEAEGTFLGYMMNRVADAFEFMQENYWVIFVIILIALLAILGIGHRHLKTEYEDIWHDIGRKR